MQDHVRVAVVGAGIAGLTVAAALASRGVRCDVFEQASQLGEVGAGLQLAPNASRVLIRLGLGHHLRSLAVRPTAIEMRRWQDNATLRHLPLGDECERSFGAPYLTVHRADLHSAMVELLPSGTMHLGLRCVAVDERDDAVLLRMHDGSVASFDLVVGADGIHSVVRDALARDEPRFSGHSIFRGLVPGDRVPWLVADPKVVLWLGPDRHCVCYPIRGGELVSIGATSPSPDWQVESWTARGTVAELVDQYESWTDELRQILSLLTSVTQWALHDRDPIEWWSSERITLIGDAAHPMLPFFAQGANQAIEDAIALAVGLTDAIADNEPRAMPAALARYASLRRERTAEVQRISRGNTEMLHLPDGEDQRRRDEALSRSSDLRSQEWLFGYDAERAAASAAASTNGA